MAQLIAMSLFGVVIGASVVLFFAMLVLVLLSEPTVHAHGAIVRQSIGSWFGAVFAALLIAATLVVAFPRMLDPLCDYFDWFGAKTASTVRHYAYVAKAPLFVLKR